MNMNPRNLGICFGKCVIIHLECYTIRASFVYGFKRLIHEYCRRKMVDGVVRHAHDVIIECMEGCTIQLFDL